MTNRYSLPARGRGARRRRWIVPALALAWLVVSVPAGRSEPGTAGRAPIPPPAVVDAGLAAEGQVVRRERGLRVDRVTIPAGVARAVGAPRPVYRVTLAGRFPPRALRYVVTAGGRRVGYGVPTPTMRALRVVTSDAAVLSGPVRARYEGNGSAPAPLPGVPGGGPASPAARGTLPGPLAVERAVYDLGDQRFKLAGLPGRVEAVADVHFPDGLPDGPYPLVLFMHGNHSACFKGRRDDYRWPCRRSFEPLPNYIGYDYIAEQLASFGFIVASVSANGVNVLGNAVRDTGMRQRGQLFERHLDLWRRWASAGAAPFGTQFVGKVDLSRIGVMGHSRGGEGAVWNVIVDRERDVEYGIDAVLPLASTDFTRRTVNHVPLAVMLPTCDGDVFDLQGVHYFDDARYRVPGDPTPKHAVTLFGANHNFFNTVWSPSSPFPGGFDDTTRVCPNRLGETRQREVGAELVVSFFRRYLAGELSLDPVWTGAAPAPGIPPRSALMTFHPPALPASRLELDRFARRRHLRVNALGGRVSERRLRTYRWCRDTARRPCLSEQFMFVDRHTPGLRRAVVGWTRAGGELSFELPAGTGDVSAYEAFQLRAAPNPDFRSARRIRRQDFAVALVDGAGDSAEVLASDVGARALRLPAKLRTGEGHLLMNQIRFPLELFAGVDLSDVRSVELRFSEKPRGAISLADLAFTAGVG